jgi:2-dehydropantoate 2-reductase
MRIGVVGLGAIGGFLAAELSAAGHDVVVLLRPGRQLPRPLVARRLDGTLLAATASLTHGDQAAILAGIDICLVCVKAGATGAVAEMLEPVLEREVPVVSFQNGLRNAERLRARLGARAVGGMVTYNVFIDERGWRCQATSGPLMAGMLEGTGGQRLEALKAAFASVGDHLELRRDIEAVQAGKLLLNLNNGICAATGLSIADSLQDRDARWCFAACIREGLGWMQRASIRPARVNLFPPQVLLRALALPNAFVKPMARAVAGVQPRARSSTLQDLDAGRLTEIDELNGAIVDLARRNGGTAPCNAIITEVVHQHEDARQHGKDPSYVAPRELRQRMQANGGR